MKFDALEIIPYTVTTLVDGTPCHDRADEDKADVFVLCGHLPEGGTEGIQDYQTRAAAERIKGAIEAIGNRSVVTVWQLELCLPDRAEDHSVHGSYQQACRQAFEALAVWLQDDHPDHSGLAEVFGPDDYEGLVACVEDRPDINTDGLFIVATHHDISLSDEPVAEQLAAA